MRITRIVIVIVFILLNAPSNEIYASQNGAPIMVSYKENIYSLPKEIARQSKYIQQEIARSGGAMPVKVNDWFDIDMNLVIKAMNAFNKNKELVGSALIDAVEKDLGNFDPNVVMKASELLQFEPGIELSARALARSLKNSNTKLNPMQFYLPSTVEKIAKYYYLLNKKTNLPNFVFAGLSLDEYLDYLGPERAVGDSLYLSGLNLREIDAASLSRIPGINSIKTINLSGNKLKTIAQGTFKEMQKLETIYLQVNQLETIEEGAFAGPKLTSIDLSRNLLTVLNSNMFGDLGHLRYLNLSNNQLTSLPKELFKNLSALRRLELNANQLQELDLGVFDNIKLLEMLNLRDNRLKRLLGEFKNHPDLSLVDFENNALEVIDPQIFKKARREGGVFVLFANNPLTNQARNNLRNNPPANFSNIAREQFESMNNSNIFVANI